MPQFLSRSKLKIRKTQYGIQIFVLLNGLTTCTLINFKKNTKNFSPPFLCRLHADKFHTICPKANPWL